MPSPGDVYLTFLPDYTTRKATLVAPLPGGAWVVSATGLGQVEVDRRQLKSKVGKKAAPKLVAKAAPASKKKTAKKKTAKKKTAKKKKKKAPARKKTAKEASSFGLYVSYSGAPESVGDADRYKLKHGVGALDSLKSQVAKLIPAGPRGSYSTYGSAGTGTWSFYGFKTRVQAESVAKKIRQTKITAPGMAGRAVYGGTRIKIRPRVTRAASFESSPGDYDYYASRGEFGKRRPKAKKKVTKKKASWAALPADAAEQRRRGAKAVSPHTVEYSRGRTIMKTTRASERKPAQSGKIPKSQVMGCRDSRDQIYLVPESALEYGGFISRSYFGSDATRTRKPGELMVVRPFEWDGKLWAASGGLSGGREQPWVRYEAIELVPKSKFKGKTQTSASGKPGSYYLGLRVKAGGKEYVLGKNKACFVPESRVR